MIADTQGITRETCDRHGPNVAARDKIVSPRTGRVLTFCGHCIDYGAASALAPWAERLPVIGQDDTTEGMQ